MKPQGVPIAGVDAPRVQDIRASLNLIRRRWPGDRACIRVNHIEIGADSFVMIAGPCAAESERQVMATAEAVAQAGAKILRGGGFKPRTSPYAFQGLGVEGLRLLRKAADEFGLALVSEAMTDTQVDVVAEYADILQVGSRSMENLALLAAVSRRSRPVLLKRGMVATLEELLQAAEFIAGNGNPNVILCERGIRGFGNLLRNTADLAAVPMLNEITRLPVIVDPSHATGRRSIVPAVARAAVAIGADGLLVEVHPAPDRALSDGPQSLTPEEFATLSRSLEPYLALWSESRISERAVATA